MLYFDWLCVPVSKMGPKVAEKSERASKGVKLTVKLCIMKCSDCEQNKDIVHELNLPEPTIGPIYVQSWRIMETA